MTVGVFLTSEVLEKHRTVFTRTLSPEECCKWLQDNSNEVMAYSLSCRDDKIALIPFTERASNVYMIGPKNYPTSSLWKREISEIAEEMHSVRPNLWTPSDCEFVSPEREIRVHVAVAANPVKHRPQQEQVNKSANRLGFQKVALKELEKVEQPVPAAVLEKENVIKTKFQVPLDSLEGDEEMMEEEPADSVVAHSVAPTTEVMSVSSSPAKKRRKNIVPVTNGLNFAKESHPTLSSAVLPAAPIIQGEDGKQYREVIVKRKTVTTEYAMSESGEMIVKDVEKMVEEIVRQEVRAEKSGISVSSKSSQGTLSGFFSKK